MIWASLIVQLVKNLPAMQETRVRFLGQEDPLEKEMATHFSILAWEIPWTEKPGGLQSMGLHRVRGNWVTKQKQYENALFFIHVFFPLINLLIFVSSFIVIVVYNVSKSYPTLCDLMDGSPPGFSVHGIFQARILEWVAISSSRRSSRGQFCFPLPMVADCK